MAIAVSIRIWLRAIVINTALLLGLVVWFVGGLGFVIGFMSTVIGAILTAPLLIVVVQLVKLSCRLPYSLVSRVAWLATCLVILLYYYLVAVGAFFFYGGSFEDAGEQIFVVAACFSLFLSVIMSRSELEALHQDLKDAT